MRRPVSLLPFVIAVVVLSISAACFKRPSHAPEDAPCVPGIDGCPCTPGSDDCGPGQRCTDDGTCVAEPQCIGLQCKQVDCAAKGMPPTTVTGTVFAPNGTLQLYGVTVYVPNGPVFPMQQGPVCDRCGSVLSGSPLVLATTDTTGHFVIENAPAMPELPLVIQVGRWRRQITVPNVPACQATAVDAGLSRLPRDRTEGDLPKTALTTGGADALECMLRKIGIADSEITSSTGDGRIHLYAGTLGSNAFDAAHGGATLADASTLWSDENVLDDYDVVFLSCEGGQHPETKSPQARDAMKAYADRGGRVFASHWHNVWVDSGPLPWPNTVTRVNMEDLNAITADVDQTTPKGVDRAAWLAHVGASITPGKIDITAAQHSLAGVTPGMAERWIYLDNTVNQLPSVQYASFTTPLESEPEDRCGRVVFSDIHVSSGDRSDPSLPFPSGGCTTDVTTLTPQEKVLAFMMFDIGACIETPIF